MKLLMFDVLAAKFKFALGLLTRSECSAELLADIDASVDEKAKVSSSDSTAGYLVNKLAAGTNVNFSMTHDPPSSDNEVLIINSSAPPAADEKAKVSALDSASGYLAEKIIAGANIIINALSVGGYKQLEIVADLTNAIDTKVKTEATDDTPGYLEDKLYPGDGIFFELDVLGVPASHKIYVNRDYLAKVDSLDDIPKNLNEKIIAGNGIAITTMVAGVDPYEDKTMVISAENAGLWFRRDSLVPVSKNRVMDYNYNLDGWYNLEVIANIIDNPAFQGTICNEGASLTVQGVLVDSVPIVDITAPATGCSAGITQVTCNGCSMVVSLRQSILRGSLLVPVAGDCGISKFVNIVYADPSGSTILGSVTVSKKYVGTTQGNPCVSVPKG